MEAMIYSLSYGRSKLARAKVTLENDALDLMSKLQTTLMTDEDLTVIGAETFNHAEEVIFSKDDIEVLSDNSSFGIEGADVRDVMRERSPTFDIDRHLDIDSTRRSVNSVERRDGAGEERKGMNMNMNNNMNKKGHPRKPKPEERVQSPKKQLPETRGFLDYAMSALGSIVSTDGDDDSVGSRRRLSWNFRLPNLNSEGVSSNAMARGAQEWRRRNGVEESRLADVDFRTGLSGK